MATPVVMPRLGDFMTEGLVNKWMKAAGDSVAQGEVIAEIESEKLNYDLEATTAGIFHPVVDEGATVGVDDVMAYLLAEGEAPPEAPTAQSATPAPVAATPSRPQAATSRPSGDVVPSTPGARRLASNLGVDISQVTPTGPRGRVVEADVRAHADKQQASAGPPGLPTPSKVVPLAGIRRSIAHHMTGSLSNSAQLSYFLEVDVTEAQRLRRETSRQGDVNIGMAHVLIKACSETLKRIPEMNTVLHDNNIMYFDETNIGMAVALSAGLIVPVISNVETKSIQQIAQEVDDLARRAREGGLLSHEMLGGTFTISVLGTVDGFTPILNQGQSGILGVGRSVRKPVVHGGEIVVREMMTLSLTADHQVIDGAVAASFMRRLQQLVERPGGLFKD